MKTTRFLNPLFLFLFRFFPVFLMVFLVSCSFNGEGVRIQDPVNRSWEDIKQSGVIKMITRYNSTSYFIHRGVERGFDFELLKEFARSENLVLEVVILKDEENLIDLLNRGDGDIIGAQYAVTGERDQIINFTTPYHIVNEVVVAGELVAPALTSIEKLDGMTFHVRKGSSGEKTLEMLKKNGVNVNVVTVNDAWDSESLLLAVSNGEIEATVVDENLFQAVSSYMDNLGKGPVLREGNEIAFGVRRNDDTIKNKLDQFLAKHIREQDRSGRQKRSAFFAGLMKRYYEDQNKIATFKHPLTESKWAGTLSPYDKLVQPIAEEYGLDWRLLIAIMAQESLFNSQAKSWAGAVGLMQVMPKSSKYDEKKLADPEINVREGARLLAEYQQAFLYVDEADRMAFALASYNAGIGHVNDARRIAIDLRKNPNKWDDVADGLLKLMIPAYYQDARYGFCRGTETVRYVREVSNRYQMYVSILNLAESRQDRQDISGVIGVFSPIR